MRRSLMHGRLCQLERRATPPPPRMVGVLDEHEDPNVVKIWRYGQLLAQMTPAEFAERYPAGFLIRITRGNWPPDGQ